MNIEDIRQYCIAKHAASESFPFGDDTLVFKVADKIFALLNLELPHSVNLKCVPEEAVAQREIYPFVSPGYHMNKKHWNTVLIDGRADRKLLCEMIDISYGLVVQKLTKKQKSEYRLD